MNRRKFFQLFAGAVGVTLLTKSLPKPAPKFVLPDNRGKIPKGYVLCDGQSLTGHSGDVKIWTGDSIPYKIESGHGYF